MEAENYLFMKVSYYYNFIIFVRIGTLDIHNKHCQSVYKVILYSDLTVDNPAWPLDLQLCLIKKEI